MVERSSAARLCFRAAVLLPALAACARQSAPPGGPPDNVPPVVVSTTPDTFAVVEPFDGPVVIRFSERVSEQPVQGSSLDEAVVVSPATSALEVEHGRHSLEISLVRGYEAGHVYRVRVMPAIQDMFTNPMVSPFELVFSTGPEFRPGVVAGVVRDRITGEPVGGARVHARASGAVDAVAYLARTDREGIYTLRYLPPGPYDVVAFEDQDRSGELDGIEPRASGSVRLEGPADTIVVSLEVLAPDTTPARLADLEAVDSSSVRIDADDYLDPADSLASVEIDLSREGGGAPEADSLLHAYEWEARSRLLQQRAATAADTAAPDTAGAPGDTVAPEPPPPDTAAAAPEPDTAAPAADTLEGPYGAGEPARAERSLYLLLDGLLEPGVEYVIDVGGIRNIAGVEGGGGVDTLVWEPPPPDTAGAPADTAAAPPPGAPPPDTAGAAADTAAPPPDTAGAGPDPAAPPPDTAGAARRGRGPA